VLHVVRQAQIHEGPLWSVARVVELVVVPLGFEGLGLRFNGSGFRVESFRV